MNAGDPIEFLKITTITRELLKDFTEASGDDNIIHLDDEAARKAGLPGVIAHGMLIASLLTERALRAAGKKWQIQDFQVRFKGMTFPDESIFVGGKVHDAESELLSFDLFARNSPNPEEGEVKASGKVRFKPIR